MLKEKKIEVIQVKIKTIDESILGFEEILLNSDFHDVEKRVAGKRSHLCYVEDKGAYVVGLVHSTRMDYTPPKYSYRAKTTSALGLNDDEGLAYGNVFLYDKEKKALLYETTKDGLFIGQLDGLIYDLVRDYENIIKFDIKFYPVMNANAMEKLLHMRIKKAVHMQFANPAEMVKKVKNEQRGLKEIAKSGADLGADLIDVTYKIDAYRDNYLHPGKLNNMLEYINSKFDVFRDNVKKFAVKGYAEDADNMTEVDFIKDKMIESIKYTQVRNMSDLNPTERKQQIILAYDRLKADLYRYL